MLFARRIIRLCQWVQKDTVSREVVGQLVRAAGSVGANYREANEALSKKDFGHRIKVARKEAKETHYWLRLLEEAHADHDGELAALQREAMELRSILSSIAAKVG